jgi:EpsD family peptidyl-prolyl cis-trans isomerase
MFALMLVVLGLMASCGKKSAEERASQSIVRVNGDEITMLQLNDELKRANIQPSQQEEASKQITQKLLDRQLLVQEALKAKLDRNPRVMQVIENTKMQILAQAYLESKVSALAKPTEDEITDYRAKHPEVFANRKIYVMDELVFAVPADAAQALSTLSDSAKTLDDVINWLGSHQLKYARAQAAHAAESLPPELLAKLSIMVVGDLIFVNNNGRTVAGRLIEIKEQPISEVNSKPLIERILLGQKNKQLAEAEIARLRKIAKIEYINKKFDSATKSGGTTQIVVTEPSKPENVANQEGKGNVASHIEKGLSGL